METAMYHELTEVLMCPLCKSDLGIGEKNSLLCTGCGEEYEIINGIPIMLPSSAKVTSGEAIQFYNQLYREDHGHQANISLGRAITLRYLKSLDTADKVILDMGGGDGIYARKLAKTAKKVIVADLTLPRLIRLSQTKTGNIVPVCGDIQTPFVKEKADIIICIAVLEHLPEPQQVLANFKELLKEDGKVCLYVPVLNLPFPALVTRLYRRLRRFDIQQIEKEHIKLWSTKELMADLETAGFTAENGEFTSVLTEFRRIPLSVTSFIQYSAFMDKLLAQGIHLTCVHK
ncbi:methyltransferase domain-containing protein [Chloroflexota bacterium]